MMKRNLIINFHKINDEKWFESVILLLISKYKLVDLSFFENLNNYQKEKGFCHITFDDGDKTFYSIAYPILKKYNIPATIFVSPKIILKQENFWFQEVRDYDNIIMKNLLSKELSLPLKAINKIPFISILKCLPINRIKEIITLYQKETNTAPKHCFNMNLDEIFELDKSELITIGSHTLNHPILKNESDENSNYEISESITELQKILRHEIKYFAYPNGIPNDDFNEREINYLKNNNISIAVSANSKFISILDNKLAFPRLGFSDESMLFVKIKLILGANGGKIKSLICANESKNRKKIKSILV